MKNGVQEQAYGICNNPNLFNICADNNESEINLLKMQFELCEYNNIELNPNCALNNTEIFDVFPNPTSEMININFYNKTVIQNIKIYNSIGQIVANIEKLKFSFKLPVDFSNFRSGNYFVSISTNYGIETKRFIKN